MQRILEPELMEDAEQVAAYAYADFSEPHDGFIERIKTLVKPAEFNGNALDLGCGPGDISRRFVSAFPFSQLDALDGSQNMLNFACNTTNQALCSRLCFIHGKLPDEHLPKTTYDLIYSNSLLHHLPDPQILWNTVIKYAKSHTIIGVMDLLRPNTAQEAAHIVAAYAANEPKILQRDFYNSLLAAFTLTEIHQQLLDAKLNLKVEQISDRHVFIYGSIE